MHLINGLINIPTNFKNCITTIGNFDGVHIGHQQLLNQVTEQAKQLRTQSVAITFEPLPQEYFAPKRTTARLTRLREKALAIQRYAPVDYLICLPFNATLATLSPAQFIQQVLVDKLAIKYVIVGADFRFGRQREGNIELLMQAGITHCFMVQQAKTSVLNHERVSSTKIRQHLASGELAAAKAMLGRNYNMMGRVIRGDQRGRQLGFPTANIALKRKVSPLAGVYAVLVHGINSVPIYGVANVGTRPTVDGTRSLLEVYLLNFNQDIYGLHLDVEFIAKIRPEYKFSSLDALKEQIGEDVKSARAIFLL